MPFNSNTGSKAGKKSKRGPAKKEEPNIKDKMELLYEKVLDDLLANQDKLTKTERVKLFVTLSGYIFPKTKVVRDEFTLQRLREIQDQGIMDRDPDPTKWQLSFSLKYLLGHFYFEKFRYKTKNLSLLYAL